MSTQQNIDLIRDAQVVEIQANTICIKGKAESFQAATSEIYMAKYDNENKILELCFPNRVVQTQFDLKFPIVDKFPGFFKLMNDNAQLCTLINIKQLGYFKFFNNTLIFHFRCGNQVHIPIGAQGHNYFLRIAELHELLLLK